MNVLIITPDRVGSTFLQRTLTTYMNACEYDKPVINIHGLLEGLVKYHNTHYNQEVLGSCRSEEFEDRYNDNNPQSFSEVLEMLKAVDHYKVARITYLDLCTVRDTFGANGLDELYTYLNDNFYIIDTRRTNLFEYVLSWMIAKNSYKMNVVSQEEKVKHFKHIYKNKINVDTEVMIHHLYQYKEYLDWSKKNFNVDKTWIYEEHISNVDKFINSCNLFPDNKHIRWSDIFGIEFSDWNRCHYYKNDSFKLLHKQEETLCLEHKQNDKQLVVKNDDDQFLQKFDEQYTKSYNQINHLVDINVLPTGIPIKLQTFLEKCLLIDNLKECVDAFNYAINDPFRKAIYKICDVVDYDTLIAQLEKDYNFWHNNNAASEIINSLPVMPRYL